MHRSTVRRGVALVVFVALLTLTLSPSPAAAAGLGDVPGWGGLARVWDWLTSWGVWTPLRGAAGSFIDPDGKPATPQGAASSRGLTHVQGAAGPYIDPNGTPQSAPPAPTAGSFIDPNG